MRAKTYGKKTRLISSAERAFIANSSPNVPDLLPKKQALIQISENIKSTTSKFRRTKPDGKASKINGSQRALVVEADEECAPHRRSPRKAASTPVPVPEPEDLISAIEELVIRDKYPCGKKQAIDIRSKSLQIRQRPANITVDTKNYLSPLLSCKNVSSCIEDFQSWVDERIPLLEIQKIGEGSFGEVYRAQGKDTVILKLMPLNAKKGKGSRSFTSVESAANELHLLEKMQKVPGFVEFRGACVLQGSIATQFVTFWNDYLEIGRTVESKDPNKKSAYPASQLWLLIEMSDAGRTLNHGQYLPPGRPKPIQGEAYLPIHRTWDIFWQIAKALAKAEAYAEFEHRDLHLGNICIKDRNKNPDTETPSKQLYNPEHPLGINKSGIEVTLIDYSLSRATFGDGHVFFYDFQKDKNLLNGQGDLQYDMYRYMAKAVGDRFCREFVPRTNIVWLYFVLRLLLRVTLETVTGPGEERKQAVTAGAKMVSILEQLEGSIHPERLDDWNVDSAVDLLGTGIEAGWFLPEDVVNG